MKRTKGASNTTGRPDPVAGRVSIRSIYSDAMREVMADPRKAIAEHDPWLAALMMLPAAPDTAPKG